MTISETYCHVEEGGVDYLVVRPGISICLIYGKPASEIGPDVAKILDEYIRFVPEGALQTYLSGDGTWKKATKRTFKSVFESLLDVDEGNYAEFHFGQEPLANVGEYGAHFKAGPLDDEFFDREANILHLEFPLAAAKQPEADRLAEFVERIAKIRIPDSGYCGYAFKHLFMTFNAEAFEFIARRAMRFLGFDVPEDAIRLSARGRIYNVSWLTILGSEVLKELGGKAKVLTAIASSMKVTDLGDGLLARAADEPMVGDVNRGAKDIANLRKLSAITAPARIDVDNIGPDDPDLAERWLSRFDNPSN